MKGLLEYLTRLHSTRKWYNVGDIIGEINDGDDDLIPLFFFERFHSIFIIH
jgi:hypothetical protein